jgi:hypothetical protein
MGDHTRRFLRLAELADGVVRPTKLKRANPLEILALQVDVLPGLGIQGA